MQQTIQQGRDYTVEYHAKGKDKRLVLLLNNCADEGLLDWKPLDGHNDCRWCPFKIECDKVWDECDICNYQIGKRMLKAVFKQKQHWARTHSTCDLVIQTTKTL